MIFLLVLTEPSMIPVVVFLVLNLFQVLMKSLLKFVVKKVASMSCFLLLHPWIPLPWLSDSLMAETNKKTNNGVIIVSVRITQRLHVGNFMASLLIRSLVIFVVPIVKVFRLHQILRLLPILIFLSRQLSWINSISFLLVM